MSNEEFENTLNLTKIALLISGISLYQTKWNRILERFINQYLYYVNFVSLYTVIFGEIYWVINGVQTGKSFVEISFTSPCIAISILSTVKSAFLYYNTDNLIYIFNELRDLHPEINEEDDETHDTGMEERNQIVKEVISKSIKFLNQVIYLLSSTSVVVIIMFCFVPILAMGYDHCALGVSTIKYPYMVKYFFDVYSTCWWPLIYCHQVWATAIVCLNIFGCDTMFYASCSYISLHFRLLGIQFENIVSESLEETKYKIKLALKRHQQLIDLVDRTELLYSNSMLFNMVSSSLLICLSSFNITVVEDFRTMLAFITFFMLSLSQISLLCLFGDMLMRSSMEVSTSIYKCSWYDLDNNSKKIILMALMRAQKACRLTAARFADLNLTAFTTILSRSWSYFALLKTVYN